MKKKIKDIEDINEVVEEYMDYYINYRPQKSLGGLTPSAYKRKYLETYQG